MAELPDLVKCFAEMIFGPVLVLNVVESRPHSGLFACEVLEAARVRLFFGQDARRRLESAIFELSD